MPDRTKLITLFEEARMLLALPGNDFLWSFWEDADEALKEIDDILATLRAGDLPDLPGMRVLFAPTGPIQEVSLSSGWGDAFITLADRFDDALDARASADEARPSAPDVHCGCLASPSRSLTVTASLGLDDDFAEVSVESGATSAVGTGCGISTRSRRSPASDAGIWARSRRDSSSGWRPGTPGGCWRGSIGISTVGAISAG